MSASCFFSLEYKGKDAEFASLWKVLHAIEGKSVTDVEGSTDLYDKKGKRVETSNDKCQAIWGKDAWNPTAELYLLLAKTAPKLKFKTSSSRTDEGGGRGCYTEDKCVFEDGKLVYEKSARNDSMTIAEILLDLIDEEEYGFDEECEDIDDFYDACEEFREEVWSGDTPTSDLYTSFSYEEFCKHFDVDDTITKAVFEKKKKDNDFINLSMSNKASANDIWEKEVYYIDSEDVIRDKDNNIDSKMMDAIASLEENIKQLAASQKEKEETNNEIIKEDEEPKAYDRTTDVIVYEETEKIGEAAFMGCTSLEKFEIPEGVKIIEASAFERCKNLEQITIPKSVTKIGDQAFFCCYALTQVTIPEGVTQIGDKAFSGCWELTDIQIAETVTEIGRAAFWSCINLKQIKIPANVQRIEMGTFSDCSKLTKVEIPEGVTEIGDYAFNGCSNLTNITIPKSVTKIGKGAFEGTKVKFDL